VSRLSLVSVLVAPVALTGMAEFVNKLVEIVGHAFYVIALVIGAVGKGFVVCSVVVVRLPERQRRRRWRKAKANTERQAVTQN
jgi:hypothetical protein